MKAVWSFWSKPYRTRHGSTWLSEKDHLLSWILSVETARVHYTETVFITDDEGAEMAAELGLPFSQVSTQLNDLHNVDPAWWSLGKLYAYRAQTEPFIHIDNDVYLWKPLPVRMEQASVLAQNPEPLNCYYEPDGFEQCLRETGGTVLEEWEWFRSLGTRREGVCCGIFGGNNIEFISYYADLAITMTSDPRNTTAWSRRGRNTILIEQYLLACCLAYHGSRPESRFGRMDIEYLFPSMGDAYQPENATMAGYTHLLGDSKRVAAYTQRLEKRVMQNYPKQYAACMRYLEAFKN